MTKNCCRCFTVSLVPVASLLLAVIFALGILVLPILYSVAVKEYVYGAVIDAGSSHTTLYLYSWRVPTSFWTHSTTGEVNQIFQCPYKHNTDSSSVNSYTYNPREVSNAFSPCLNESYEKSYDEYLIDPLQRQYTPLYLGATAGMRLVQLENATLAAEIMGNITQALKDTSISQYKFGGAEILNDSTEATSGWISANYHHLSKDRKPFRSYGALDMGGASVQITFETNDTSEPAYIHNETLFGVSYQLYARSLLCYGQNEAYNRYLAYLITQNDGDTTNVPDPCLFKGAQISVNSSEIYTVCVNSDTAASVFGHSLTPPTSLSSDSPVSFKGTGNSFLCRQQIETVFSEFCKLDRNCVNNTFSPPVSGDYLGFSGFFHIAKFFNSTSMNFTKSSGWGSYQNNISSFCNMSYDQAKKQFSKDHYLTLRCFVGQFAVFLLEGFGFNDKSTSDWMVQFTNETDQHSNKKSLSWALGYMMDKTNNISQDNYNTQRPFAPVDLAVGMIILAILCVIFIVFFVITFNACRKALSARNGYQSI